MALDTEGNEQDAMAMADMYDAADTCPVPVIARVQGAAIGGGMGLCAGARLGDDDVGDRAQAHPTADRGALDASDHRNGTGVERLVHVGHRHGVLFVAFGVERHRGSHPVDVGTGAERPAVAGQDDDSKLGRTLSGKLAERGAQVGDQRRVERVVDVRPGERDAGHFAGRPGPFDAQMSIRDGTHPSIVTSLTTGYALAMLIGIDHLVIAVPDPDSAAADLATALGMAPGGGGRHDLLGTYNRLIWLGDTYLELIGVFDAGLAGESWVGRPTLRVLGSEAGTGLATWAVATDDIEGDIARLRETGSDLGPVQPGERTRPDGRLVTWRLAAAPTLEPTGPPFLIEHDPTSAEWTADDRAARATEPARLTTLEIGVTDVAATTFRSLKTAGLRFRPSLQGGGARDADIGPQIVRIRPRRADPEPPTTIRLTVPDRPPLQVDLLGCRWIVRP